MAEFIEVDVRGLSCPEPVLLVMDAMDEHPGETIRVIGDEAHTRTNIEKTLTYQKKSFRPNRKTVALKSHFGHNKEAED